MNLKHILPLFLSTLIVGFSSALFVFVPQSLGLLSLAEPIFQALALISNPYAGALIGGLGYAFADILLGYPYYLPAALTVKALAGYTISRLNRTLKTLGNRLNLPLFLIWIICVGFFGCTVYSGEVYFGYPTQFFLGERVMEQNALNVWKLHIPPYYWIIICLSVALACLTIDYRFRRGYGLMGLSLLAGALLASAGYLLYEAQVLPWLYGIKVDAQHNFTTNLAQAIVASPISIAFSELFQTSKYKLLKKPKTNL